MASNSEDLLVSDYMEGIFIVIDRDILAKPNNLETEFAVTVSKIQDINSEGCFYAKISEKHIKQKKD